MAKKHSHESEKETVNELVEGDNLAPESEFSEPKVEANAAPAPAVKVAEPAKPEFEVVMRANGMDMESINGQLVYFVGAHSLLRTPPEWADQLGLEPKWTPIPREGYSICPGTFKDAKGQVHPAYFLKTKTEIQLWMERK